MPRPYKPGLTSTPAKPEAELTFFIVAAGSPKKRRVPGLPACRRPRDDAANRLSGLRGNRLTGKNGVKTRYVQAALDAVLSGQPVATKTTEPVGCAITRPASK